METPEILKIIDKARENLLWRLSAVTSYENPQEAARRLIGAFKEIDRLITWINADGEDYEHETNEELLIRAAKEALVDNPDIVSRNFFSAFLLRRGVSVDLTPEEAARIEKEQNLEYFWKDFCYWLKSEDNFLFYTLEKMIPQEIKDGNLYILCAGMPFQYEEMKKNKEKLDNIWKSFCGFTGEIVIRVLRDKADWQSPPLTPGAEHQGAPLVSEEITYDDDAGCFYPNISGPHTAGELHHLIADLQTALAKYAPWQIENCLTCNQRFFVNQPRFIEGMHCFPDKEPAL